MKHRPVVSLVQDSNWSAHANTQRSGALGPQTRCRKVVYLTEPDAFALGCTVHAISMTNEHTLSGTKDPAVIRGKFFLWNVFGPYKP